MDEEQADGVVRSAVMLVRTGEQENSDIPMVYLLLITHDVRVRHSV